MATKKKTPKKPARPRAAKYVVVTAGNVATGVLPLKHSAPEEKCVRCALDAVCKLAKMPRYPAVGESVTIVIHGTTAKGFIGGPGNEELPQITNPPKVQGDEAEWRRCKSVGPEPERFRCGLIAGHKGEHRALIPTAYPWSGVTEADVFSHTVPMTKAQAKVAKRGQR